VRHRAKFGEDWSNRSGDMAYFRFSRWRPSAILDFQKLEFLTARTLLRAKMRHLVKFCEDRSNPSGDMADFVFSRWRPSAILDFQKLKILTSGPIRKPNMRYHTKFRENRSNRSRDMADIRFFKMATVHHLGFVLRVLGPPTKSIWWSL